MGANDWRNQGNWPLPEARDTKYFLYSTGKANSVRFIKWRKRVGVEPFRVLQTKDFRLESIASPAQYLNFRTPIAHDLAHTGQVPIFLRGTKASETREEFLKLETALRKYPAEEECEFPIQFQLATLLDTPAASGTIQ